MNAVPNAYAILENIPFDELTVGRTASITRSLTGRDIAAFAAMSGDVNPVHLDAAYAGQDIFHSIVGHGMWCGALISTVLGTMLPGPGTICLSQTLEFKKPVRIGDVITVSVKVEGKDKHKPKVTLACRCVNQHGDIVVEGRSEVLALVDKISIPRLETPSYEIHTHAYSRDLLASCSGMPILRTAIVHPVEAHVIEAVAHAAGNLIDPVLIGPRARILAAAAKANVDITPWPLIDTEHSHESAEVAAAMASKGQVGAIMKGALHTEELLSAIVKSASGLLTERRISHAYVMDVPDYPKPLIVTDAAINIAPTIKAKADICQNAINLWHVLFGVNEKPRVALLAAVETVSDKMQATTDAAGLCKMVDRGQITGAILDGPLAFDNAVSEEAAREKGIVSEVAGRADILVLPNIEAANILSKQMIFLGDADAAGIVLGARVPIILTSRADSVRTRLMSCALAVRLADARRKGLIK